MRYAEFLIPLIKKDREKKNSCKALVWFTRVHVCVLLFGNAQSNVPTPLSPAEDIAMATIATIIVRCYTLSGKKGNTLHLL